MVVSTVIGEYLADVQTLRDHGKAGVRTVQDGPFSRSLLAWGFSIITVQRYISHLAAIVTAERETPLPVAPRRRPRKRNDARVNDHRLRLALVAWRNERDRVNRGLRRLAQDAGISEASVRRALLAWQADGQLARDDRGKGKTQSIRLHLDHPAWSGYKPSHPPD